MPVFCPTNNALNKYLTPKFGVLKLDKDASKYVFLYYLLFVKKLANAALSEAFKRLVYLGVVNLLIHHPSLSPLQPLQQPHNLVRSNIALGGQHSHVHWYNIENSNVNTGLGTGICCIYVKEIKSTALQITGKLKQNTTQHGKLYSTDVLVTHTTHPDTPTL